MKTDFLNSPIIRFFVLQTLVPCFLTTEITECAAALIYPKRNKHDLILVFLVNLATNPAAVFFNFLLPFRFLHPVIWTVFIELIIWLIEAVVYKYCLCKKRNPFLFSFILNAVSYGIGLFF